MSTKTSKNSISVGKINADYLIANKLRIKIMAIFTSKDRWIDETENMH